MNRRGDEAKEETVSGLVISRGVGETVYIGDYISVTVTKVAGRKAALLIDAPKDVSILREELVLESTNGGHKQRGGL